MIIASRSDLILTHRPDFDAECEVVWAQLQIQGAKSVFIGCYYKPPNDGALSLDELDLSISGILENNASPNIWLGGDFNLGDINWNSNCISKYATKGALCEQLLNITTEYNLSQMISKPTHHTDDSESLLDLFLTSSPSLVHNIIHMPGLGLCKHDAINIEIDIHPRRVKSLPRMVFLYGKMNHEGLIREVDRFCTDFLRSKPDQKSVEENWVVFRDNILRIAKKHIPMKKVRYNHDLPWMTRHLKHLIRRKNRWHKKFKKSKSNRVWKKYISFQRSVKDEFKRCYNYYIENILGPRMEENPKIFWRHVNRGIRRDNNNGIAALNNNGTLACDAVDKCEILNSYFKSVFTKEDKSRMPDIESPSFPVMPDFCYVTGSGEVTGKSEP